MKFAIILGLMLPSAVFAGQSGGGTGAKALQDTLSIAEVMRVYTDATTVSSNLFGKPDNFVLDVQNRKVRFPSEFELTYDEVHETAAEVKAATEGEPAAEVKAATEGEPAAEVKAATEGEPAAEVNAATKGESGN
jgi:hypothetical protein